MLSHKIKLDYYINEEERNKIVSYSKLLSNCYNLCLDSLHKDLDFKKIHLITKQFAKEHNLYSKIVQNTGRECINAVKSYLALKKKDNKSRFPKNYRIYSPIIMDINLQQRKNEKYIGGGFKFLSNKQLQLNPFNIIIDFSNCEWYNENIINIDRIKDLKILVKEDKSIDLVFSYSEEKKEKEYNKKFISIDLGISSIASIYSPSEAKCYKVQTKRFKGLEKEINKMKSKCKNKQKGSNHYEKMMHSIKKKQTKLTHKRKDYLHKTSKNIINHCVKNNIDNIICGDIKTKKLVKKNWNNKSTQNEGLLSRFKGFLQYKANINSINFIVVNEAYTSQINCVTDKKEFSSELKIRDVEIYPNVIVDRDINSAVNIAKKYGDLWLSHTFNYKTLLNVQKINTIL